jgi:hypothetical protein
MMKYSEVKSAIFKVSKKIPVPQEFVSTLWLLNQFDTPDKYIDIVLSEIIDAPKVHKQILLKELVPRLEEFSYEKGVSLGSIQNDLDAKSLEYIKSLNLTQDCLENKILAHLLLTPQDIGGLEWTSYSWNIEGMWGLKTRSLEYIDETLDGMLANGITVWCAVASLVNKKLIKYTKEQ